MSHGPNDAVESAMDAGEQAVNDLGDLHADDPGDLDEMNGEMKIVHEFCETIAEAVLDGFPHSDLDALVRTIADNSSRYTKTDISGVVDDNIEDYKIDGESTKRPFDRVIREDLTEVSVTRTSDGMTDTVYMWRFDGEEYGTATLETHSGDSNIQFSWNDFRKLFYHNAMVMPSRPIQDYRGGEEWMQFITTITSERTTSDITIDGPRTQALVSIKQYIRASTGVTSPTEIYDEPTVGFNGDPFEDPENGGATEIQIPNSQITRECKAKGIPAAALFAELEHRGLFVKRLNGRAIDTAFGGIRASHFWVLDYPKLDREDEFGVKPDRFVGDEQLEARATEPKL